MFVLLSSNKYLLWLALGLNVTCFMILKMLIRCTKPDSSETETKIESMKMLLLKFIQWT